MSARAPLRASRPLRAALGNACALPQLRALTGSNPRMGPEKNGPVAGAVCFMMVGDEGFEPPALCV